MSGMNPKSTCILLNFVLCASSGENILVHVGYRQTLGVTLLGIEML
jgi:hypothetical protein